MKRCLCLCLTLLLLLSAAGCKPKDETAPPDTEQEQAEQKQEKNYTRKFLLPFPVEDFYNEEIVLPPTRVGTDGTMLLHFEKAATFDFTFENSDAIVRLKVENWLGEEDYNSITFYRATVLECYYGAIPQHIIIYQEGCSTVTVEGDVLFTYGNELVLLLKKSVYSTPDLDVYVITGSYPTVLYVSYVNEKRYLMGRGRLPFNTSVEEAIGTNYYWVASVSPAAHAYLKEQDPYLDRGFRYIFAEEDFKELIDRQSN